MKEKTIVLLVLITIASVSSFFVLKEDGYFHDIEKGDAKVLATAPSILNQVALAQESVAVKKAAVSKTPITKTTTTTKKAPVKKKITKKKVIKKKHKLNLDPPVITPSTAPFSAKNRNN